MKGLRTVVVTGASTGIGEGCARYLAARGFHVFAGVRREADAELTARLAWLLPDRAMDWLIRKWKGM
jgi:NAD(P)-dependent dehydrogenase (short-subunit alcohol dehydrogenase family)